MQNKYNGGKTKMENKNKTARFCSCELDKDQELKAFLKREKTKAFCGGILVGVFFSLAVITSQIMLG
jgi:hypothetical protein